MPEIVKNLLDQGCELKEIDNPNNAVKCSESYIQKNMNKPWSLFVKYDKLEPIRDALMQNDDIEISGIGIGGLEKEGAWSKIVKFDTKRHADFKIYDKELFKSDPDNDNLKRRVSRMKRITDNYITDYPEVNIGDIATEELSDIRREIEYKIEENINKSMDGAICSSDSNAKRMWAPRNNDVLRFEIGVKCVLPRKEISELKSAVETMGPRKTFKTTHRNGINSIVTPDDNMYLRKFVIHDKDLGGPYAVFGIRDSDDFKSPNFMDKIKGLESHLSG